MKFRGIVLAAAAGLFFLLATGRAHAAQSMFLEISGVPGEVTIPAAFVNQINVLAVSWGGSKICGSSLNLQDVSLTKSVDKASTKLLAAMRDATVYPIATLRFVRSDDGVYTIYKLTNASVSSISTGGSGGEDRNTENVTLTFSQMQITYTFFDGFGKPGATTSETVVSSACP